MRVVVRKDSVCLFGRLNVLLRIPQRAVRVHICLIGRFHILVSVGQLRTLGQSNDTFIIVDIELRFPDLARLSLDDYDTVRSPHTVYGSRGSIFQDSERLDIIRVDMAEIPFHTVYKDKRT